MSDNAESTDKLKVTVVDRLTGKPLVCPRSLRDEFAMAALTGLLSNAQIAKEAVKLQIGPLENQSWHASTAYEFADAMMKERENDPS